MASAEGTHADLVLFMSLMWLSLDLYLSWDSFRYCPRPIHHWLLASYLIMLTMRAASVVSSRWTSTHAGFFLLNLRQGGHKQTLVNFMWFVITPLFSLWTMLGTYWIFVVMSRAPDTMPGGMHSIILVVWQVMSYLWFGMYGYVGLVAWRFERCLRSAESDLRSLEDGETIARWGRISNLENYRSLPTVMAAGAMTPLSIGALPGVRPYRRRSVAAGNDDCPICLENFQEGDTVRELKACSHVFHKSCVDLWLLRSSECPLCKTKVQGE